MASIANITGRHKRNLISFDIYTECNELPMLRFIQSLCGNTTKPLIKQGNPPAAVLQHAWERIYEQYLNLCSDEESHSLYVMELKVQQKQLIVQAMEFIMELMQKALHLPGMQEKIASRLNNIMKIMKVPERFVLNADTVASELQTIRILYNEYVLEMNELSAELNRQKKDNEGKAITEKHFYEWATCISTYFKMPVQLSQLTVTEFESLRSQYKQAIAYEKQNQQKRRA